MSILDILLALVFIGLPAFGIVHFARPNDKFKTAIMLVVLSIALGGGMFWYGRMFANMESNMYYTARTKRLLERTVQRLENPRDIAALAKDLRCVSEQFHVTYERVDVEALFGKIEDANGKAEAPK